MSPIYDEIGNNPWPPQQSKFTSELRSPSATSTFAQADTAITSRSRSTANTAGRARQSSQNGTSGFWRTPSFLSGEGNRSTAQSCSLSAGRAIGPQSAAPPGVPAIELPASPAAGADEPRSFFDPDSESDGDLVISRASSVRAQRPQLVQHSSSTGGRSPRGYDVALAPSANPGPSLNKAQQVLGSPLIILHDFTPRAQRTNHTDTRPGPSISKARQLLGISLKNLADLTPAVEEDDSVESPGGLVEALETLSANALDGTSTTAFAPTPSSPPDLPSTPNSVVETPSTPSRIQVLSTLPSPIGGFDPLQGPRRHLPPASVDNHHRDESFHRPQISATDGLRSNPIRDSDISRLHRAISAPPLPFRHPHRKVTIQPLDLEAAGERMVRQSVVSTPYPTGAGSIAVDTISPLSAIASAKIGPAPPKTANVRDRFPSPIRPEFLYLEFAVARHPLITTLVQVMIEDKSTYDDEALFNVLRKSYRQTLLGFTQYLASARALRSVTFTDPRFDTPGFLRHLQAPRAGRRRKTWLTWLRELQVPPSHAGSRGSEKTISFSSPASTPRMPFFKMHKTHPRLTFHFEFAPVRIALAIIGTITTSALATVLWVLFGVPGVGPGRGRQDRALPVEKWQVDAQGRVLTGLVLGAFVALLGTVGGAGWTAASWLLL